MNVLDQFKQQISAVFEKPIEDETEFVRDLNATSFHYMFIMGTVEDLFQKTISYAEIKACKSVGDLLELCEKLL